MINIAMKMRLKMKNRSKIDLDKQINRLRASRGHKYT